MISVDQALKIVLETVEPLDAERVPLADARGHILRDTIRADMDLPPFDRARMDGYAVRAEDVATVPARLVVIGEVAAGATFDRTLGQGEAVKIFTGAPIPAGADAVQKVEVTEARGDNVVITESVALGQFITARASEVAAGQVVAESGVEIGPAQMSVLASFGYARVRVGRRPLVAVMSTGSELVEVTQKPSGAQIRNSNSYTISAYASRDGAETTVLGNIPDTMEATRDALLSAAEGRDLVITTGGVSVGDYDLVKAALAEIGAEIFFDKVAIRPGKPTVFARLDRTYFFGLPGNPVSTSVTYNVFARPAIRKMLGDRLPMLKTVKAFTGGPIKDGSGRRSYLPALLSVSDGRAVARPLKWAGSSDLVAFMGANCLIVAREEVHDISAGELVEVLVLEQL